MPEGLRYTIFMKHIYIVAGLCAAALIGGAAFYFFGSGFFAAAMGKTVPFSVVGRGQDANELTTQTNYRIKNMDQLQALWTLMHASEMPPLPQVDFSKNEVLAIMDGSHATDGYDIRVVSVTDKDLERVVAIEHMAPAPECAVNSVLTSPFEIIVLPKMPEGLTLQHEDSLVIAACQ